MPGSRLWLVPTGLMAFVLMLLALDVQQRRARSEGAGDVVCMDQTVDIHTAAGQQAFHRWMSSQVAMGRDRVVVPSSSDPYMIWACAW